MAKKKKSRKVSIKSWKDLFKVYEKFAQEKNTWIFRGQAKARWGFKTSLQRALENYKIPFSNAPYLEGGFFRRFKRQTHHYLTETPDEGNYMEWFALMQHYGAPTRLLDWTYSFWVAVYFAIEESLGSQNERCAIWCLNTDACTEKAYSASEDEDFKKAIFCLDKEDPNARDPESFKSVFLRKPQVSLVLPMNAYKFNKRLIPQQGVFLCPGNVSVSFEDNINAIFSGEDKRKHIFKYSIALSVKRKKSILYHLHRMNIHRATLYPDLEGFAGSLPSLLSFPDYRKLLKPDSFWQFGGSALKAGHWRKSRKLLSKYTG